jgi:hypothetical protein
MNSESLALVVLPDLSLAAIAERHTSMAAFAFVFHAKEG